MTNMRHILILIILFISLTSSGCWNQVELENWALISGIGLDIIQGEEDLIEMTVQIIRTRHIGTPNEGGAQDSAFWTVSATGRTTSEAARNLEKQVGRRLFFPSTRVLILGEDMARYGIDPVLDWFFREENVSRSTWLLVAKDHTAKKALAIPHNLELIPAYAIDSMMISGQEAAGIIESTLHRYFRARFTTTSQAMVVGVDLPKSQGATEGPKFILAIFHEDHLVGWLNEEESKGILWFMDATQKGPLQVKCDDVPGYATIEVLKYKRTIDMDISENGEIRSIIYNVDLSARMIAQTCSVDFGSRENLEKLEKNTETLIKEEMDRALEKVQIEYHSDVFFLGREIERYYPQIWNDTLSKNWHDIYIETPIETRTSLKIMRIGMATKPTNYHRD